MSRATTGAVVLAVVIQILAALPPHCQAPVEPTEREVKVALRAGGRAKQRLDDEFSRLGKKSSIRPSLPHDFAQGGYSELMQEMLGSWRDFMDYSPERDDAFEEGERKSRGKFTWRKRLRQLAAVVRYGLQKEEIMSTYGGKELYPAVPGTYWLDKLDFEGLRLPQHEARLFGALWAMLGPKSLPRALRRCDVAAPCACHFAACGRSGGGAAQAAAAGDGGELRALELRATRFRWPRELPPDAAPGLRCLALEGAGPSERRRVGALQHPEFWPRAFPGVRVLQLMIPSSTPLAAVAALLRGQGYGVDRWQEELLGLVLSLNEHIDVHDMGHDPVVVPAELLEPVCALKKLRRLKLDGYISHLPSCLGQLPLLELDVRGLQFRDDAALPPALASLGNSLVSFIAYSQGLDRSCDREPPWNKTSQAFLTRCRARPSWDAAQPMDSEEEDAWAWQCPWESWLVRLDHPQAPWWSWRRLERFWVDANFFHGAFPEELARAWPAMRSLDLQLNQISGPLPKALAELQNLTALRVHRNNFSGEVPPAIFGAPNLQYTNFEGNARLGGCIPRMPRDEETWHLLDLQIQGTQITGLCKGRAEL
ncbi:unnamed protein product [Effrenium voratum]|nr:unnamed protein product [Effrenium voratum]